MNEVWRGLACLSLIVFVAGPAIATNEFEQSIQPVLRQYCNHCHSTKQKEGELDLEQFLNLQTAARQPKVWEHVLEQLANSEMPPKDEPPLPAKLKAQLTTSLRGMLEPHALFEQASTEQTTTAYVGGLPVVDSVRLLSRG